MKSLLVEFIQQHPADWEQQLKELNIKVNRDNSFAIFDKSFVIFNYDINADFSNPLVRECRGIILDMSGAAPQIACFPFTKFGNYGESYADEIDWKTARVQDKLDGSLLKLWYRYGVWHVSTNSVINAEMAPCGDTNFFHLFTKAMLDVKLDLYNLNKNNTYIFELISPQNRVCVDYDGITTLYHIGTRSNITGEELNEDIGVQRPKEYPLHSLEDCIAAAKALNKDNEVIRYEGFVVVDANYHRIKVKSPQWILVHHLLPNGELTDEQIIDLWRDGELEEVLTYIPSLEPRVTKIMDKCQTLVWELNKYCGLEKDWVTKKQMTRKDWCIQHKDDLFFSFGVKYVFDNVVPNLEILSTKKICQLLSAYK